MSLLPKPIKKVLSTRVSQTILMMNNDCCKTMSIIDGYRRNCDGM
ncbi:MAG: hypothetical protein ACK41G_03940 [Candidatus Thermochlorobacter sp.]